MEVTDSAKAVEATNAAAPVAASQPVVTSGEAMPPQPVVAVNAAAVVSAPDAVAGATPVAAAPILAPPTLLVPSLRGKMFREGSWIVCRGVWAMSDKQHSNPDLVSEFEFKINTSSPSVVAAISAATAANGGKPLRSFPLDGLYQGWFKLKKILPLKGVDKVDEKDIHIRFIKEGSNSSSDSNSNSSSNSDINSNEVDTAASSSSSSSSDNNVYKVEGDGSNKFGRFTLKGTFNENTSEMVVFREYIPKPVKVAAGSGNGANNMRIKRERSSESSMPLLPREREGAGRIRRQSSFVKDFEVSPNQVLSSTTNADGSKKLLSRPDLTPTQRLNLQMERCNIIMDEILKLPNAIYFLEPVDPIKLGIPDYNLVIKQPMDLTTVSNNLSSGTFYNTPNEFAEHIKLIFKNAITYNASKDNVVHISARECTKWFEDKYRSQISSLNPGSSGSSKSGSSNSKKSTNKKYPSGFKSGSSSSRSKSSSSSSSFSGIGLPPDGSAMAFQDMQRKMLDMQSELERLRNAVGGPEQALQFKPLTIQEKKDLINNISKLPPSCIDKVVQIVKHGGGCDSNNGNGNGSDDMEIPLDDLDIQTLRKLQSYTNDVRKRQGGFDNDDGRSPSNKRTKHNAATIGGTSTGTLGTIEDEQAALDLFSPESFAP